MRRWTIRTLSGGAAAIGLASAAAAQTIIGANFQASSFNDTFAVPPDTMGFIGSNHYVEFINGQLRFFAKNNGAAVGSPVTDLDFWANAGVTLDPAAVTTGPRILYDPASRRWFASQVDVIYDEESGDPQYDNNFLLAVSDTGDPTGTWKGFSIRGDPTGNTLTEFARLGVNADAVTLVGSNYTIGPETLDHETIVTIPKADLLQVTPSISRKTQFSTLNPATIGYIVQPVVDFGASVGHTGLLAADNDEFGKLVRTNVLGATDSGATLSSGVAINTNPTRTPPTASQPGTTAKIVTGDHRLSSYIFKVGGSLWGVQGIGTPDYPAVNYRAGIRWYQIDEATNAVTQQATIGDMYHDCYYPSIAANQFGDVVIGFTRSSSTEYASAYAVVGSTDGLGVTTFGSPVLLKAGVGPYDLSVFDIDNEWGRYSATSVDPADPWVFWTEQEWADEPDEFFDTGVWGTQVSELIIQKPNESRWKQAAGGTFGTTSNWLAGTAPGTSDHAIFSKSTGAGSFTVTFAGAVTNKRASVRQGTVSLALAGQTYALTETDATKPSLAVGEFGGEPQLTVSGGTLQTVNTVVGAGLSEATFIVTGGSTSWSNSGSVFVGGTSTTAGGTGTLRIESGAAANITGTLKAYSGGTILYNGGTIQTGGIDLTGGGKMTVSVGGAKVVRTGTISIDTANLSRLDLADNDLIATAGTVGTWNGSAYTGMTGLIRSGRNGGAWTGGGIVTSQTFATTGIRTTLGISTAAKAKGIAATATAIWNGQTVTGSDVLVMYTYGGDANLDGKLNVDDYGRIDTNIVFPPGDRRLSWANGDFNYSGSVDIDDYAIIDVVMALQLPSLGSGAGAGFAVTPVPEPAATAIITLGGATLLSRRRRARHIGRGKSRI